MERSLMKEIKESKKKNKYKSLTVGVNTYKSEGNSYGRTYHKEQHTSTGKWKNHSEVVCSSQLTRRYFDNSHTYVGSLDSTEEPWIEVSRVGKREYQPCDTLVISKNPDGTEYPYSKWVLEWKESLPSRKDIQCIIGCKLIPKTMFKFNQEQSQDAYRRLQDFGEYKPDNILNSALDGNDYQGKYWLSVVYISRKDGNINNDIYLRWCNETKLPFPDDMIHTPLKDDRTWSDECLNLTEKKAGYYGHTLSMFDYFRNKKKFMWFIPFNKWGNTDYLQGFTGVYKSRYSQPSKINTWKKRRQRKVR